MRKHTQKLCVLITSPRIAPSLKLLDGFQQLSATLASYLEGEGSLYQVER